MPKEEKQRLKDLSKSKKNASEKKRTKRQQDIERILVKFKGVRIILGIKTAKKRVLIIKRKNEKGEGITSRKGIADAFGGFHKRLYEDKERDDFEHEMSDDRRIPFHRKLKQLFFYSGRVKHMQLQFLARVELFFKQLKGYSF